MATKTKKSAVTATVIPPLYGRVLEILDAACSNIARTVNTTQTVVVLGTNSETVCRNFGASLDALNIFHAVRGKSWQPGILKTKGAA